jgi:hypothetical protein
VRRPGLGALLVGAVLGISGPLSSVARAERTGPVVSLRAPPGCPSPALLEELVAEHLGHAADSAPALRIEVEVRREEADWIARVDVRGAAAGQRELEGASCREVIDAAALVIALAVEDEGHVVGEETLPMVLVGEPELNGRARPATREKVAARVERPRADAREVERAPSSPEQESVGSMEAAELSHYDFDVAPRTERPTVRHTRLAVRAGAAGASGMLPRQAAGFDLAISGWRDRNGVELSLSLWPQRTAHAGSGEAGAELGLWAAGLRGCRTLGFAAACAGGELGRMFGRGMDVPNPRQAGAVWGALGGSVWLRWRVAGAAAIYAGLEGLVPITRPRFEIDSATLVYQPAAVAGRALLGLELSTR